MKDLFSSWRYLAVALFFFLLQGLIGYTYLRAGQPSYFLWFCNHTPLLIGLAILFRKVVFVKALLNVGFFLQLFWAIDFFGMLLFQTSFFHVTDYMFVGITTFSFISSLLAHVLSPLIGLGVSVSQPQKQKTLVYSAVYLVLLYLVTLVFATSGSNYNLLFYVTLPLGDVSFPGYTLLWPFLAFVLVVLPTHFFQKGMHTLYLNLMRKYHERR